MFNRLINHLHNHFAPKYLQDVHPSLPAVFELMELCRVLYWTDVGAKSFEKHPKNPRAFAQLRHYGLVRSDSITPRGVALAMCLIFLYSVLRELPDVQAE